MTEHPTDLLAVHALDAVDDVERDFVEQHVAECPRCRQELDGNRGVTSALGNTICHPPERLWSEIAARLGDRQVGPASTTGTVPPHARNARARQRGFERRPRWRATAAVAAVAVVVGLLALALSPAGGARRPGARDPGGAAVAAAMAAPGHRVVSLVRPGGGTVATVVLLPSGEGFLVRSRLQPAPLGRGYELWAIVAGSPTPIALMGPSPTAAAFTVTTTPAPTALAITEEPASGSLRPTTSPIAAASL